MIRLFRLLLFPFAVVYFLITEFRNFLFQSRIMRGAKFDRPVICVGNLATGGTGKSPMVEYLIRLLLKNEKTPAVLSRGYGRKTKGFLLLKPEVKASDCGDEPLQFKHKFPEIDVAVCERRVDGIIQLIKGNEKISAILLDDAFQHRSVKPSFTVLTTSFYKPFFSDFILPVGDLREMRRNASRANAVVVTKCPEWLTEVEKKFYRMSVGRYSKAPVFFSRINYGEIKPVFSRGKAISLTHNVLLVTGIADPHLLEEKIAEKSMVRHLRFGDHHDFSEKDMQQIAGLFNSFARDDKILLTTEKDAKRFQTMNDSEIALIKNLPVYFIEMEQEFLPDENNENEFDKLILSHVGSFE